MTVSVSAHDDLKTVIQELVAAGKFAPFEEVPLLSTFYHEGVHAGIYVKSSSRNGILLMDFSPRNTLSGELKIRPGKYDHCYLIPVEYKLEL